MSGIELSEAHVAAVNRRRRVVVNFDTMIVDPDTFPSVDAMVKSRFHFADEPDTCIDSIWWNWSEGNVVPYPSKYLPTYNVPGYRKLIEQDINIVALFQAETHKRGLEGFFSHRMNGGDNDPGWDDERGAFVDDVNRLNPVPMKQQHPDWLIEVPYSPNGLWNYAVQGVRDYYLRNLREVAEDFDFDGIELDFARSCPALPPGRGWLLRHAMTDFIRSVRLMTLEVEHRRGRPFLLAARVPENLIGCHFDGFDVETWARRQLVDLFVMGCRNFDVDVAAFRRITEGTPIKLYCAIDDHHSSDGYCAPPIEVLRGVFANWYHQGSDGIQTFNFKHEPDPGAHEWMQGETHWDMHLQAYREMGDPAKLRCLDKTFVINRRGGGHGQAVIPDPEEWSTPRLAFHNTNMLAQLPAALANDGKADTLLTLYVGDDVYAEADSVADLSMRVLLNDPAAASLRRDQTIEQVIIRDYKIPKREGVAADNVTNHPPSKDVNEHIEVRINNILLERAVIERGWLMFKVQPKQLAVGDNLVGIRLTERAAGAVEPMLVEKVELHVKYRRASRA